MCCSMTCWDCMIMQDSDIIVSSRSDDEEHRQIKSVKSRACGTSDKNLQQIYNKSVSFGEL